MNKALLRQQAECEWELMPTVGMRVPGLLYASEALLADMDEHVLDQIRNVASLPGIVRAAWAMPDAHWGYGFPIGGVAAFDPEAGGVISAGGVGFDISCGVRALRTGLSAAEVTARRDQLAEALFHAVPAGVGSTGNVRMDDARMKAMLRGGAAWAVRQGYGSAEDLARVESHGVVEEAAPDAVSEQARRRQLEEMGTLGSGNHYLEVQVVAEIHDKETASAYGLHAGEVVVSLHCGSRGLGHQVATEYARRMATAAPRYGIHLADRELASVPVRSEEGQAYLGAMRAAVNCALANRQILAHLVRQVFHKLFRLERLPLLYDVSHNVCSLERHVVDGQPRLLFVHRKGATRAFGPGHPELPEDLRPFGQPVLVGGSMGTASYVLAGMAGNDNRAFSSACHGAGRSMSRSEAMRKYRGEDIVRRLAHRNILVRSRSLRGIAEEAPDAYKSVAAVVEATERAGLARRVARLEPLICVKG